MVRIDKKNIYILLIFIVLVFFCFYYFPVKTIVETPLNIEELKRTEYNNPLIEKERIIETTISEKYKIINRSVLVPENILNKTKVILLTIDDGPTKRTKDIVEILKKHNAKAIFFINGMNEKNNKGIIEFLAQEGFYVGNHTWSHINLKKQADFELVKNEITKNGELINKLTGSYPLFFRAPYGESNQNIRKFVKDNNMIFMDWSGSVMDWDKSTVEKDVFISNVMKNIHSGSIILIHEHPWSVTNLDSLLTTLEDKGYTYVDPQNIIE